MGFLDKGQQLFTKFLSTSNRPPLEKYYGALIAVFVGYSVADLGINYFRPLMLPREAPPIQTSSPTQKPMAQLGDYNIILDRNIFNEDGKIPPALADKGKADENNLDRPAVLSQLPIQLLGTIVHGNPKYSIATVSLTSKNMSSSYKIEEEIQGLAQITKIERKKVTFINLNNRRLEYIEIPDDAAFNFDIQAGAERPNLGPISTSDNLNFNVSRVEIDAVTKDLSSILTQARVEPVFSPDGIGIDGYRFASVQGGSIFEKLGFRVGDVLISVNGQRVTSPSDGMKMFSEMRDSSSFQVTIDRGGREEKLNYSVK